MTHVQNLDYTKLIERRGSKATVKLPEKFVIKAFDDQTIGFDHSRIAPEIYGYEISPAEIVKLWRAYEKDRFPLGRVTEALVMEEAVIFLKHRFAPIIPSWEKILRLIYLLESCDEINGIKSKKNKIRKELSGISKNLDLKKGNQVEYRAYTDHLITALNSWISELTVLHNLKAHFEDIKILKSGPDFEIGNFKAGRIEVKSTSEQISREFLMKKGETEIQFDPFSLDLPTLLILLCWKALKQLDRAFQNQGAHIVFVDVTRTFAGYTFFGVTALWDLDLPFEKAIRESVKLADSGKETVVVFADLLSTKRKTIAYTFDRNILEEIGKPIQKLEGEHRKKSAKDISPVEVARLLSSRIIEKNKIS
jgi:hypothetical protein